MPAGTSNILYTNPIPPTALSGLIWYVHADLVKLGAGSNISKIIDQSSTGADADTTPIASVQLVTGSNGINGLNAISGNGGQAIATSKNLPLGSATQVTAFIVLAGSLTSLAEIFEYTATAGTNAGFNILANSKSDGTSFGLSMGPQGGTTVDQVSNASAINITSPTRIIATYDRTIPNNCGIANVNGLKINTTNNIVGSGIGGTFIADRMYMFGRTANSLFWTGKIRTMGVFNRMLSHNEVIGLDAWLSSNSLFT